MHEEPAQRSGNGNMSARIVVDYVDANGVHRFRKMTVHRQFYVSEQQARDTVTALRQHNDRLHVEGSYTVSL